MTGLRTGQYAEIYNAGVSTQQDASAHQAIFPDIEAKWLSRLSMSLSGIKGELPLVVALVSSVSQEGGSTVAVNLARTLQRTLHWRVALVDANLPSPALHRLSLAATEYGLAEVLRGEIKPESAFRKLDDCGLGLMPAGASNGTEFAPLFSRKLMSRISPAINPNEWDAVILDCPPLLSYPGSAVLAAEADATVLVVRAESTRFQVVNKALENLMLNGANVIGTVLNNVRFYIPEWLYQRL
jgi:polysaccharide biosynthesis transport protein